MFVKKKIKNSSKSDREFILAYPVQKKLFFFGLASNLFGTSFSDNLEMQRTYITFNCDLIRFTPDPTQIRNIKIFKFQFVSYAYFQIFSRSFLI